MGFQKWEVFYDIIYLFLRKYELVLPKKKIRSLKINVEKYFLKQATFQIRDKYKANQR